MAYGERVHLGTTCKWHHRAGALVKPIRQSKVIRSFSSFLSMKLHKLARVRECRRRRRRTCAVLLSCKLMAFVVASVKRATEQERLKD